MLNAGERDRLAQAGIETAIYGEDRVAEERFIAYTACCCAKEKLIVSYSSKSAQGEELSESEIITFIREHFRRCIRPTLSRRTKSTLSRAKPAFELTAALMRNGGELYESLKIFLKKMPIIPADSRRSTARRGRTFKIDSRESATRLFGMNMNISPSRAERHITAARFLTIAATA